MFCYICVFCSLVVLVRLSVPVQVTDWIVSEMTYNVLMGTLHPAHSLTHSSIIRCGKTSNHLKFNVVFSQQPLAISVQNFSAYMTILSKPGIQYNHRLVWRFGG